MSRTVASEIQCVCVSVCVCVCVCNENTSLTIYLKTARQTCHNMLESKKQTLTVSVTEMF